MKILPRAPLAALILAGALACPAQAAPLTKAEVTRIKNEVRLLSGEGAARPATVGDVVEGKTAVRTGRESRAELTFTDETLARLGANSIFSFEKGTRDLELQSGVILLQVPKGAGGAKIKTAAVTAAITGTSVFVEYSPRPLPGWIKVVVLEGTLRLYRTDRPGESILIKAGEMVVMAPGDAIPDPVEYDIDRLVTTSFLISGDFDKLLSDDLIQDAIDQQQQAMNDDDLQRTNLMIFGAGTTVFALSEGGLETLDQRTSAFRPVPPGGDSGSQPQTGGPGGPGSPGGNGGSGGNGGPPVIPINKFGPPAIFPDSYVIEADTVIVTDPVISNPTATHQGKIYRDQVRDGLLSEYLFGSTSTFDEAIGFDDVPTPTPLAVFLFKEINMVEGPVVNTSGGPTSLALVATDRIITPSFGEGGLADYFGSQDPPPQSGSMDLDPLDSLLIATVNGPIEISSFFTFTGTDQNLELYARGSESGYVDFTGNTNIPDGQLGLTAETDISLGGSVWTRTLNAVAGGEFYSYNANVEADHIKVEAFSTLVSYYSNYASGELIEFVSGGDLTLSNTMIAAMEIQLNAESMEPITPQQMQEPRDGGPVALVSEVTGGPGITIGNSSQLAALTSIAGTDAVIRVETKGGDITIEGDSSLTATATGQNSTARVEIVSNGGTIGINASTLTANGGEVLIDTLNPQRNGIVNLVNSTLTAADVHVRAIGPDGALNINGGSFNADQQIMLYAEGANSRVNFTGDTTLNFGSAAAIAGKTVHIDYGRTVTVNGPDNFTVYTDNPEFNDYYQHGNFQGTNIGEGGPNTDSYDNRPAFRSRIPILQ